MSDVLSRSSFASRKDAALPKIEPPLISWGQTEIRLAAAGRDGRPQIIEGEMLIGGGNPHTATTAVRLPNGSLMDTTPHYSGESEKVVPLGVVQKRTHESPHFPTAPAEEVKRIPGRIRKAQQALNEDPVDVTAVQDRLARLEAAIVGKPE